MRTNSVLRALPLLALAALLAPSAHAAASLDTCKGFVDSLPATLTTQGVWCLRKDVGTGIATGAAITIAANNVTLDCNGFKLGGLAAGNDTRAVGVASDGVLNTTLRACHIRGFEVGANLANTAGGVVEDNRFEGNTVGALIVGGSGSSVVRRNLLLDTGGTTHPDDWGIAFAVSAYGPVQIRDNLIDGVTHPGMVLALRIEGDGLLVQDNRIGGLSSPYSVGINAYNANSMVFRDNVLFGPGVYGLYCSGYYFVASGNVVSRFTYSHGGCSAAGDIVN
jgi:hypothetical protein